MIFVCNVQRCEYRYFKRINRQSSGRNLAHLSVNIFGQIKNIVIVAIRPYAIRLVIDLHAERFFFLTHLVLPTDGLGDLGVYDSHRVEHRLDFQLDRVAF